MDKLSDKLQEMFALLGCAFDGAKSALHSGNDVSKTPHVSAPAKSGARQKKSLHTVNDTGLSRRPAYDTDHIAVWNLLGHSGKSDLLTDAYAWVIATCCNPSSRLFVPALGLDHAAFIKLLARHFPQFVPPYRWLTAQDNPVGKNRALYEFPGLLQLLLDHRACPDEHHRAIAHLIATACMGDGLLWHDLGLPDQAALSALFCRHFPTLAEKYIGDAQLKSFLYQQLCERESITASKSPGYEVCLYYPNCFGAKEGEALL